jgi:hypothetical protein
VPGHGIPDDLLAARKVQLHSAKCLDDRNHQSGVLRLISWLDGGGLGGGDHRLKLSKVEACASLRSEPIDERENEDESSLYLSNARIC